MAISNSDRPRKPYKVYYEHTKTFVLDYIIVEASSSFEAAEFVQEQMGEDYDLVKCVAAKAEELN